jgi:putative two-component system response regulator
MPLLQELLNSSLILADEWDDLPDDVRNHLLTCMDKDLLLALLLQQKLLTQYQVDRIDAGARHHLVLGNYRVLEHLGRGGMGVVYKAEHLRMRRLVAIKVLKLSPNSDQRLLRRFNDEMRTIAQMKHPNIVEAIDDGYLPGSDTGDPPIHYFVMEYVPGQDLNELVAEKGPLSPDQACNIAYQVATALAEAHKHKVVHRDIKPSNIRITPDFQAKLLDFGLVRRLHHRITDHGVVLGTVEFIAPEQASDATAVDIRADIFSLGATLFWCLTGKHPFPSYGSLVENLMRRMSQQPPSIRAINRTLPLELDAVVSRMMALKPDDRFPTPQATMNVLLRFLKTASGDSVISPASAMRDRHGVSSSTNTESPRVHRVLVADDSRMVRGFCAHTLQDAGIECDQAENGAQALAAVDAKKYDLLLTDWVMPGLSGLDLCCKLRESPPSPNFKIIIFSSTITDDNVAMLLNAGADDYLPKDFSPVQMVARVQAALRLKDAQDRSDRLNRTLRTSNQQLEDNLLARDSDLLQVRNALILGLTDMVCRRDAENLQHVLRIQRYCRVLAEEATGTPSLADQIDQNFISMLECCSPLHDIGKVALPDNILSKTGELDMEERLMMQTHTVIGAETLQNVARRHGATVAFLQMAIDIARHHHERYDGQGYPDRLKGNDIPLAARFVAICDTYDGLRTRRTYKPALSHAAALTLMFENSPGQFDPLLLQAFRRCESEFARLFSSMQG